MLVLYSAVEVLFSSIVFINFSNVCLVFHHVQFFVFSNVQVLVMYLNLWVYLIVFVFSVMCQFFDTLYFSFLYLSVSVMFFECYSAFLYLLGRKELLLIGSFQPQSLSRGCTLKRDAWQWTGSISLLTWGLLWTCTCSLEVCSDNPTLEKCVSSHADWLLSGH